MDAPERVIVTNWQKGPTTKYMPRIYYSNVNFVPAAKRDLLTKPGRSPLFYSANKLRETAEACGAGGIEITPIRSAHYAQLTTLRSAGARALADTAVIVHSGWRGVPDPKPADPDARTRPDEDTKDPWYQRAAARLVFPKGEAGMRRLSDGLYALGNKATGHIVYADEHGRVQADLAKSRRFPGAMMQPTPDLQAAVGAKTPAELIDAYDEREMRVSYDDFMLTRQAKFSDTTLGTDDYLRAFLKADIVDNVRVSVFRNDFHLVDDERVQQSINEGHALITGGDLPNPSSGNSLARTFEILEEHQWQGNVTIAAPFLNKHLPSQDPDGMTDHFRQLTEGVKQRMPWIPADAWQPMSSPAA